MKVLFRSLTLAFLIASAGCNQENQTFESTGKILGQELANCACCYWWLSIDGLAPPPGEIAFHFVSLPEDSEIDLLNATFPLDVQFNWTQDTTGCEFILLEDIEIL